MPEKKPLLRAGEALLLLGALGTLAAFSLWHGSDGPSGTASVTVGSCLVMSLPLSETPDQLIDMSKYGVPASLEVKNHKIRFVDVTCPDHICEKAGWIWKYGQSAVCMPNQAAVVIV